MVQAMWSQRVTPLVLVVDDDSVHRMLFRETVQLAGFDVIEAENGTVALGKFKEHNPDLVLLDVMMPEMDGYAVCREIREMPSGAHTPVLMVTGLDDIESIERAYDAGGTDFLGKPVNWTLLNHRVRYMYRAAEAFSRLRKSEARLAEAQHVARMGHWEWDIASDQIFASKGMLRIFELEASGSTIDSSTLLERVHPDDRDRTRRITLALQLDEPVEFDYRILLPDGSERMLSATAELVGDAKEGASYIRGTCQDITERHQIQARMNHLAHHDALTDLPNRSHFNERLQSSVSRAKRSRSRFAVLCLDLDGFKEVNDTHGHAAGDQLLQVLSDRLRSEVRGSDTLARLGGDEFAIIQVGIEQPRALEELCERLLESIHAPMTIDGSNITVGASIGVAMYPEHGSDQEELLVNADTALYHAKSSGRNAWCYFAPEMHAALHARRTLEHDLRRALEEGWFELHYQPQVALSSNEILGAEALLRMRHPERGLVSPDNFIPLAEETQLIVPIGRWVLNQACADAANWQKDGFAPVRVSVNLSPVQLRHSEVVDDVVAALTASGLNANLLEIEITETTLIHDNALALDVLNQVRALGVQVAMDDFGTGYSSLRSLQLFPFNRIKIDRSFVHELETNTDAAAIIRAIVALGHSLKMRTTAEGVETLEQLNHLIGETCDEAQGYYYAPPMPVNSFMDHLKIAAADKRPVFSRVGQVA